MLKPAVGFLGAELHVGYELGGGSAVKSRAASFYLKAKPSSTMLPEHCLGEKVAGEGSWSPCQAWVCPECQHTACHVGGGCGWWGSPSPAAWSWWHVVDQVVVVSAEASPWGSSRKVR